MKNLIEVRIMFLFSRSGFRTEGLSGESERRRWDVIVQTSCLQEETLQHILQMFLHHFSHPLGLKDLLYPCQPCHTPSPSAGGQVLPCFLPFSPNISFTTPACWPPTNPFCPPSSPTPSTFPKSPLPPPPPQATQWPLHPHHLPPYLHYLLLHLKHQPQTYLQMFHQSCHL